jgi:hypothetical protein
MTAAATAAPATASAAPPHNRRNYSTGLRTANAAKLDNPALKKSLTLWFATGKDDRVIRTTQATVDLFKKHGFAKPKAATPGQLARLGG